MAHIEKYKRGAVGHMVAHYERKGDLAQQRENIDEMRTHLNYTVGIVDRDGVKFVAKSPARASWKAIEDRMERVQGESGRKIRKDAVAMGDVVVTKPSNVPDEDAERFFMLTYKWLARTFGEENALGGYVHMDETTPHMHCPFTPVSADGRWSWSAAVPRSFYQKFHKELSAYLEKELGYTPEILLSKEKAKEKALSSVPHDKLDAARAALDAEIVRPAEVARDEAVEAAKSAAAEVEAAGADLAAVRAEIEEAQRRLERLRHEESRAGAELAFMESVASDCRAWESAGRGERGEIVDRICTRCDRATARVAAVLAEARQRVTDAAAAVKGRARGLEMRVRHAFGYQGFPALRLARILAPDPARADPVGTSVARELARARRWEQAAGTAGSGRGAR